MTGSLCTSPALSDGEASNVAFDTSSGGRVTERRGKNLEKVLKLMQQAIQESNAKLKESQSEVVNLQAAIVHQLWKLRNYLS